MSVLYESHNTGDDTAWYYRSITGRHLAQIFTAITASHKVSSVKAKLYRDATATASVTAIITTLSAGVPDETVKLGTSNEVAYGDVTSSSPGTWIEFTFSSPPELTLGTQYAVVLVSDSNASDQTYYCRVDSSAGYAGGSAVVSNGATWSDPANNDDLMFEVYGSEIVPVDINYTKKLVAVAGNELWYESSAGTMAQLAASAVDGQIITSDKLDMCEAYGKILLANGTRKKVADFVNKKLTTDDVGANPPDPGTVLTGGTSGATMVVDYITTLSSACTVYGKKTSSAAFTSGETVTGTDDDDNAISFATNAGEVSGPHWYDYTPYGDDTSYGALPGYAGLIANYRGRVVLSGDKSYPNQWYMSRQSGPFDFNYTAGDAQSPVAGNNADAGEVGDTVVALMPYKDDMLVFGCANTMWYLTGDPMEGGSLSELDLTTGVFGSKAFCWGGDGSLYFWGMNGVYKTSIPGSPVCISEMRLPDLVKDEAADQSTHRITMTFDRERSGIIICITKYSDGTNSNYWLDLRTDGFFPESYPEECSVLSMFYYDAISPTYRKLVVGCNDGYIRLYDPTKKDDDIGATDEAIDSYMKMGPIPMSADPGMTGKLLDFSPVIAGGGTGGSQSDSSDVAYKIFVANNSEEILEKLSADGNPVISGTESIPKSNRGRSLRKKIKGTYFGFKLGNSTAVQTWALEQILYKLGPSGRLK